MLEGRSLVPKVHDVSIDVQDREVLGKLVVLAVGNETPLFHGNGIDGQNLRALIQSGRVTIHGEPVLR